MRGEVSLEVEGEGAGDDDVGIGNSANKSENHFYRLHYSNCHLAGALSCDDHLDKRIFLVFGALML